MHMPSPAPLLLGSIATMAAMEKGSIRDTKIETITSFIMRECGGDRELAVFMNAMQVTRDM